MQGRPIRPSTPKTGFDGRSSTIDRRLEWYWRHLRKLDRQFDFVVSASDDLTQRLRAGGVTKAQTIPMGVQPGVFSPDLRDEDLRREMLEQCGLPPEATLLVGLGRMAPEKRWPMICEAVFSPLPGTVFGSEPSELR